MSAGCGLLPGVLHAYTVRLTDCIAPVPTPGTPVLSVAGLALLAARRRAR